MDKSNKRHRLYVDSGRFILSSSVDDLGDGITIERSIARGEELFIFYADLAVEATRAMMRELDAARVVLEAARQLRAALASGGADLSYPVSPHSVLLDALRRHESLVDDQLLPSSWVESPA